MSLASYLTSADADAIAATLPSVTVAAYLAASSGDKTAALLQASVEVDRGMRYQGRKYDFNQCLEFPRAAYEPSTRTGQYLGTGPIGPTGATASVADTVWDWDLVNNVAKVPDAVNLAVLYQADSILRGDRQAALDAQFDGVKTDKTGPIEVEYDRTAPGVKSGLCRAAHKLLDRYRLKQGRSL